MINSTKILTNKLPTTTHFGRKLTPKEYATKYAGKMPQISHDVPPGMLNSDFAEFISLPRRKTYYIQGEKWQQYQKASFLEKLRLRWGWINEYERSEEKAKWLGRVYKKAVSKTYNGWGTLQNRALLEDPNFVTFHHENNAYYVTGHRAVLVKQQRDRVGKTPQPKKFDEEKKLWHLCAKLAKLAEEV